MTSYSDLKCSGCGSICQTANEQQQGYKLDLNQPYCLRCFKIRNYNTLINQPLENEDFLEKIALKIKPEKKCHFFYCLDFTNLFASQVKALEQLMINHQVTLVINKIDFLLKSINKDKVIAYIKTMFKNSKLEIDAIILVSALKNYQIDALYNLLKKSKYNNYLVGASNSGKSTLINKLLKLNNKTSNLITTSYYYATTLNIIELDFNFDFKIYDTPGIVNNNSIINWVDKKYYKTLNYPKELKTTTFQLDSYQTIFIEKLAVLNFIEGEKTSFHFYTNSLLRLHRTNLDNKEDFKVTLQSPSLIAPLSNIKWKQYQFKFDKEDNVDIHIASLGWVNFNVNVNTIVSVEVPENVLVNLVKPLI